MDKLLLHSCCAPCSVYCVDTLRADGIEPEHSPLDGV